MSTLFCIDRREYFKPKYENCSFLKKDFVRRTPDEKYGLIICSEVIGHIPEPELFLDICSRGHFFCKMVRVPEKKVRTRYRSDPKWRKRMWSYRHKEIESGRKFLNTLGFKLKRRCSEQDY